MLSPRPVMTREGRCSPDAPEARVSRTLRLMDANGSNDLRSRERMGLGSRCSWSGTGAGTDSKIVSSGGGAQFPESQPRFRWASPARTTRQRRRWPRAVVGTTAKAHRRRQVTWPGCGRSPFSMALALASPDQAGQLGFADGWPRSGPNRPIGRPAGRRPPIRRPPTRAGGSRQSGPVPRCRRAPSG
jgi:hypothetical protein